MTGWVSCDDIETLFDDEVRADLGAVTAAAMQRVETDLRADASRQLRVRPAEVDAEPVVRDRFTADIFRATTTPSSRAPNSASSGQSGSLGPRGPLGSAGPKKIVQVSPTLR
jgi:hypothetical protein